MKWTEEVQLRFNELRQKALAGTLSAQEKNEFDELVAAIEANERNYLANGMMQRRAELIAKQAKIQAIQDENSQLVRIIVQQEQLMVDAQRWLAEFEHRRKMIQQSYAQLTGETLA